MSDEAKQSFINEQFEEGVFLSDVTDYVAFELSGIVKQVTNTTSGGNVYVPYPLTSIEFGYNGKVCSAKYENKTCYVDVTRKNRRFIAIQIGSSISGEKDEDPEHYYISLDTFQHRLNKIIIEDDWGFADEMNEYHYNQDNVLSSILRTEEVLEGGYEHRTEIFKVTDVIEDNHHNWVKRTLVGSRGRTFTEQREITYHEPPALIGIKGSDDIYCYYPNEDYTENYTIKRFDKNNTWVDILEGLDNDMYGFGVKDFKVVGSKIYVMLPTGSCGAPGNDYAIYYIDTVDKIWHYIIGGGEDSGFVDDMIKAHVYWLIKEGTCTAENEYGDSLVWIKLHDE